MTLHIFNPEHDIALASHLSNFTAPHAARQLRHDVGWLPAIWCAPGDVVMVDDVTFAQTSWRHFRTNGHLKDVGPSPLFADRRQLGRLDITAVEPWGWDSALKALLLRAGVKDQLLPSDETLEQIRTCSGRQWSARLLPQLRLPGTVGEAFVCREEAQVDSLLVKYRHLVVKAPWSSSGRGIRFIDDDRCSLSLHGKWLRNLIRTQGEVTVEPYYKKVKDFGMEFHAHGDGTVTFEGLSLFNTKNGAYTGNIIATEQAKREVLSRYVPPELIDQTAQLIAKLAVAELCSYRGPFGVDMMIVGNDDEGFLLHPCVELNLRNTMGSVAIRLTEKVNPALDPDVKRVMRLEAGVKYQLKIVKT